MYWHTPVNQIQYLRLMIKFNNFSEAKEALYTYIQNSRDLHPNKLDRMVQLMNLLSNPQNKLNIVHIGGTSGKTSTAYYSAAMLVQKGFKVGLTVSPHVDEINERVQINLNPLEEGMYCRLLSEFLEIIRQSGIKSTYFELLIAFSFWTFHKLKVDYAVIEVGIGGLFDSTNVISRPDKVCIITDISLDHTEILGKDLESIAKQKAGIILPGNQCFINDQNNKVISVINKHCLKTGANLHVSSGELLLPSSLPGFQRRNASLAFRAVSHILSSSEHEELTSQDINQACNIKIPARMEVVKYSDKTLILDGSHNDQKVNALVTSINKSFYGQEVKLLLSFGGNKKSSVKSSLEQFRKLSDSVILTEFKLKRDNFRSSLPANQLAIICKEAGFKEITIEPDPELAFNLLLDHLDGLGVISGSYYLLNHVRPLLSRVLYN